MNPAERARRNPLEIALVVGDGPTLVEIRSSATAAERQATLRSASG